MGVFSNHHLKPSSSFQTLLFNPCTAGMTVFCIFIQKYPLLLYRLNVDLRPVSILIKNNRTTAPKTATTILVKLKPLTDGPPSKRERKPPIKAPIIPMTMLAIAPCSASVCIISDAIQPANAPKSIQTIILTILNLLFPLMFTCNSVNNWPGTHYEFSNTYLFFGFFGLFNFFATFIFGHYITPLYVPIVALMCMISVAITDNFDCWLLGCHAHYDSVHYCGFATCRI